MRCRSLLAGKAVSCEPRGLDKYGRTLGICFVDGRDVNAQMVRQGFAWAFIKYSTSYVKEEAEARTQGIGIWQGEAMPAWEYRAQRWTAAEPQAPQGCAIKGNVTKHGRIYHMPWSPWYAQIRIEPDKGKRWFCTEAEASPRAGVPCRRTSGRVLHERVPSHANRNYESSVADEFRMRTADDLRPQIERPFAVTFQPAAQEATRS